mgnify:CR=1 FL=1
MRLTTSSSRARTAVRRANQAIFVVIACAISAATAHAIAAVESRNLLNANFVPGVVTAERVLQADTGLYCGVVTAGSLLGLAT